jgi:hypothetical protein
MAGISSLLAQDSKRDGEIAAKNGKVSQKQHCAKNANQNTHASGYLAARSPPKFARIVSTRFHLDP